MREIRPSGSEGGAGFIPVPTPISLLPFACFKSVFSPARHRFQAANAKSRGLRAARLHRI
jgi:hypothetical protein